MGKARLAVAIFLLILTGCGGHGMAEVSGAVTLDGKPLDAGTISFTPADGSTTTEGGDIKNGHYRVRVPVGLMKVSISAPKVIDKEKLYPTPDSPWRPVYKDMVPKKYNESTELQYEVVSGRQTKDFPLESK